MSRICDRLSVTLSLSHTLSPSYARYGESKEREVPIDSIGNRANERNADRDSNEKNRRNSRNSRNSKANTERFA